MDKFINLYCIPGINIAPDRARYFLLQLYINVYYRSFTMMVALLITICPSVIVPLLAVGKTFFLGHSLQYRNTCLNLLKYKFSTLKGRYITHNGFVLRLYQN